jgi:NAD(P)-dependent dehydrogenase (short-subunit alcohol dehydrogenase family)
MGTLAGKVALVTGGGAGLGRAGAIALARAGARVLVGDLDADAARDTAAAIAAEGGEARATAADAGRADEAARMVREAVAAYGALHVLYNNAGVAWPGRDGFTPNVDPSVWDEVIRINLSSVFYCAHAAIPAIAAAGGGSIVNTASSMARLPLGALDGYAASKGGVALLTQSMAPGCGRLGIRVNAICPGYVDTPMNAVIWGNDALKQGFARGHATGLQTPEEIADLVVFLAGDASRSLTGAVIACDRGWTAFKQPPLAT